LLGFLAKTDAPMWCFGGQFVVLCVADVVLEQPYLQARKMRHGFWIYFCGFPFRHGACVGLQEKIGIRSLLSEILDLRGACACLSMTRVGLVPVLSAILTIFVVLLPIPSRWCKKRYLPDALRR
jgi:hypothetical protein